MNQHAPILAAQAPLAERLARTRALTLALAEPLSEADACLQPFADASPAKWHLAHTTWFFETFVLRDHVSGYRAYDERFPFLFNSYYEGEGARLARDRRGMISRPSLAEVREWRGHVDERLQIALPQLPPAALALVELGIQHEQQHQELLLTDVLAGFAANPLEPAYMASHAGDRMGSSPASDDQKWIEGRHGVIEIGADGDGFSFDCEGPRHRAWLEPYRLAARPVSNADWLEFVADGGYRSPTLWLSDGWDWVRRHDVTAPLYWSAEEQTAFTLAGRQPLHFDAPVAHVSYYEADAFARWAGARLPTEAEYEVLAAGEDAAGGNQLDRAEAVRPHAGGGLFGNVWCWTASAFLSHPGFTPVEGTVGEYNGKFMSGQMVLKGASCATPRGHSRASYRNFFPPAARWQFTGVRLARDA
ncbi:ergothioneine biosynthesis protein EgtB [Sphingomonas sp. KRR8]|uniref:ergothioneine biosynthesis protein EgtB n=1 Tax=Sphingomonas sp. KRR8 TaxID=2942996 RepID=UPI0020205425|nr:ergothioneine biosynthesis protein EgtB [Sphingomonas sp. KRR8]URD60302.1 ergothioneine biosynthesis protein EgtB [Sphingomonas sp. KRR8]